MNKNLKPNTKRALVALALVTTLGVTVAACDDGTQAQKSERQQAAAGIDNLLRAQPVPAFGFSQIRQNLIELQTALANGTTTTTAFLNMGSNDPVFMCSSIGAPIAATTELTNPLQTEKHTSDGGGNTVLNQMDPTGVYTGDSSGTYVMCVGQNGQVNPVYWEGTVMTAFGPAHWDKAAHQLVIDGPSGSKFSGIKK